MSNIELPVEGEFTIQTIGPIKSGTSKKGNPYRIIDIQFRDDPNWYNTFWSPKEDPVEGQILKGKKSYDDEYNSFKFEIERSGGKGNWNPAGANATLYLAAATALGNYLALDPEHKKSWEGKRKEDELPFQHYLRTIGEVAKLMKEGVVSLGSLSPENKTGESTSSAPAANGAPAAPPIESFPGEEPIE